jgi:RNA-directed DNA polymerase
VVLCHDEVQAQQVRDRLENWLRPGGLRFNEDKTRIVHLSEGFDFLGVTVRRFDGKLIIKPSKTAVKRLRMRMRTEDAEPARFQHGIRSPQGRSDQSRMGGLPPAGGVIGDARVSGSLHVVPDLQVGQATPSEEVPCLGGPVLREVPPDSQGPLGVRQPGHRCVLSHAVGAIGRVAVRRCPV